MHNLLIVLNVSGEAGEADEAGEVDEASEGFILEVDGYFPADKHDYLSDYPPAPERYCVSDDLLSEVQQEMRGERLFQENTKLVSNLYPKKNYILHYRNLKLYQKLGFVVTNVHRGVKFQQKKWLKPFIEKNTDLRKMATSDDQKDLFKLMINAVFGESYTSSF